MNLRQIAALSASALMLLGSTVADARPGHRGHRGHHHPGGGRVIFYAAPVFAGAYAASRYYYPPAYYYPPSLQDSQTYWYYCPASRAYYPHVQTCRIPWQRVIPQPPG